MNTYFSIFISGLSSVVEKWLKGNSSPNLNISELLDGLVVYQTNNSISEVREYPIFNNSFVLLKKFKANSLPIFDFEIERGWLKGYKTFRIIYSNENQISKINKNKLAKYEQVIIQKTRLKLDRTNPDTEIWIIKRSEGINLVGLRITQNSSLEKTLHKGELRPQLAYFLNYLSEPNSNDIFLDPFTGHGSIPKSRIKYFPAKVIIVSDNDSLLLDNLKNKLKDARVEPWNALNLKEIQNNSIDKIVTDPPWGIYIKELDIEEFYKKSLNEFARITKKDGIIVILTSQKALMDRLLTRSKELQLKEKLDILVSGKKSSIYKIIKI